MQKYTYVLNPNTGELDLVSISGISDTEFEIIAPGNTGKGQIGNWKFLIDANFNFCKYKCTAANVWEIVEINAFIQAP
jgi:hypothetical protein